MLATLGLDVVNYIYESNVPTFWHLIYSYWSGFLFPWLWPGVSREAYQGQRYPPFLADPPPYLSCSVTVIWRAKLTCNPIRPSSDSRHAHLLLAVLTIWENLSTFSIAPVKKSLGVSLIHFFSYLTNNPWANIVGCTPNICLECGHFLPPGLLWLQTHLPFLT